MQLVIYMQLVTYMQLVGQLGGQAGRDSRVLWGQDLAAPVCSLLGHLVEGHDE